jgi:hypothetical protein
MRGARSLTAIVAAICVARVAVAQEQPVFRSDVYVVALELVRPRGRVWDDLTSKDFSIVIDQQVSVPVILVPYPGKPGFYRLTFSPPGFASRWQDASSRHPPHPYRSAVPNSAGAHEVRPDTPAEVNLAPLDFDGAVTRGDIPSPRLAP